MDQILGNLFYCFVYIDNIHVFSPNLSSHVQHLCNVLGLCHAQDLTIGLGKCEFGVPETKFLGHHLTSSGLRPLLKHTSAIRDFPPPWDKPGLQEFLVVINFYRRFLCNAAQVLAPLSNALKGLGKSLPWYDMLDSTFRRAKVLHASVLLASVLLASVPVLTQLILSPTPLCSLLLMLLTPM